MKKVTPVVYFVTAILTVLLLIIWDLPEFGLVASERHTRDENGLACGDIRSKGVDPITLTDDPYEYPPVPKPDSIGEWNLEDSLIIAMYDVSTEAVSLFSYEYSEFPPDTYTTEPFEGLYHEEELPRSVIPPDTRSPVSNTAAYPWSTVCALIIHTKDGKTFVGSGAIGGCGNGHGYHVLTAGHCVWLHGHHSPSNPNDCWAAWIEVIPGYNIVGSTVTMPYGRAYATLLRTYTAWTILADGRFDFAYITLDRNVGDHTGWMGGMTHTNPGDPMYTGTLHTSGYPNDLPPWGVQWWTSNQGHSATWHNHAYWMDTADGQSGSPVWLNYLGWPYMVSIHTSGGGGINPNYGVRLNPNILLTDIPAWCNDPIPVDKPDLEYRGPLYSGFSPRTVTRGVTPFNAYTVVRNVGTAQSTAFNVNVYASVDNTITVSDHLIATIGSPSTIQPFHTWTASWTGTLPAAIPAGWYWVGWIIDVNGQVNEFDESNNVGVITDYRLRVNQSTAVQLISMVARLLDDDCVEVAWEAENEVQVAGYNVYRSESSAGTKVLLNDRLIPARGGASHVTRYSFEDRDAACGSTCCYWLEEVGLDGSGAIHGPILVMNSTEDAQPCALRLAQNYPNPFNPMTNISFELPFDGPVLLEVFGVTGQLVATLVDRAMTAGRYNIPWNASGCASGVYFSRLTAGGVSRTRRMVLLR